MLLLLLSLLACVDLYEKGDHEHGEGTEAGCDTVGDLPDNGAVQAIGDSMFDFVGGCQDAPDFASVALGERVENNAVGGATMLEDIPDQYQPGGWEWVIVIGGGNDLDCDDVDSCTEILEEVEAVWRALTDEITDDGAKVALVGYPDFPSDNEEIGELWAELGSTYLSKMEAVADGNSSAYFVDLRAVMDGDEQPELFDDDLLHPSVSGARVMGEAIAEVISAN